MQDRVVGPGTVVLENPFHVEGIPSVAPSREIEVGKHAAFSVHREQHGIEIVFHLTEIPAHIAGVDKQRVGHSGRPGHADEPDFA